MVASGSTDAGAKPTACYPRVLSTHFSPCLRLPVGRLSLASPAGCVPRRATENDVNMIWETKTISVPSSEMVIWVFTARNHSFQQITEKRQAHSLPVQTCWFRERAGGGLTPGQLRGLWRGGQSEALLWSTPRQHPARL